MKPKLSSLNHTQSKGSSCIPSGAIINMTWYFNIEVFFIVPARNHPLFFETLGGEGSILSPL